MLVQREDFESYRSQLLGAPLPLEAAPQQVADSSNPLSIFSNNDFQNAIQQDANDFEGVEFELNSNESFTYSLTPEQRDSLSQSSSNIDGFFDRYRTEQGGFDIQRWNMDRFLLDNLDDVIRAVGNQTRSNATENVVKEMKNIQAPGKVSTSAGETNEALDINQQIVQELFGNPFSRKK